jgi:anti-sigma regulatory factor (Ser/Thr protein kinase)
MSHTNEVPTWCGNQDVGALSAEEGFLTALASWARAFPGTPENVGEARRFVAHLLLGSPFRDDAIVVLSELFTNAVLHTDSGKTGGLVTVQVARWRQGVRIAVTDQGSRSQPVIRDPGAGSEPPNSGHGLYLAAHLAGHLAWHDDPSGRTIAAAFGKATPEHLHGRSRGITSSSSGPVGSGR